MLITECNNAILKLRTIGQLSWREGIRSVYLNKPEKASQEIVNVLTKLDKFVAETDELTKIDYRTSHIRWLPGNAGAVNELIMPQLLPSIQMRVMAELKARNKIVQIGTGKGKGIIAFNLFLIPTNDEPNSPSTENPITLVANIGDLITEYLMDIDALKKLTIEQEKVINSQRSELHTLNLRLNSMHRSSWS